MSDKTRLALYFYLSFLWTAAKRLKTFGRARRDAPSLAKTVNLDWWELGKVQIFGAFLHSASGSDRKSAPWWNVLELKSSTSAWRGDGKRGLARIFWKRVVWTRCVCLGRKKEGVTLSKTFTPVEELQAFPMCFCPLWTCDCIAFFSIFKDKLHIGMKKCGWRDF